MAAWLNRAARVDEDEIVKASATARGVLTVRMQLDRNGQRVPLKTRQARREIAATRLARCGSARAQGGVPVLAARRLRLRFGHRWAAPLTPPAEGWEKAIEKAKLDQEGKPKLRWHDLRHTAISGLIADGIPLSTIARIAGHANTAITGRVYAHEIERAEQGDRAREAMERRRGNRWANEGQNQRENEAVGEARKVAVLKEIRASQGCLQARRGLDM